MDVRLVICLERRSQWCIVCGFLWQNVLECMNLMNLMKNPSFLFPETILILSAHVCMRFVVYHHVLVHASSDWAERLAHSASNCHVSVNETQRFTVARSDLNWNADRFPIPAFSHFAFTYYFHLCFHVLYACFMHFNFSLHSKIHIFMMDCPIEMRFFA